MIEVQAAVIRECLQVGGDYERIGKKYGVSGRRAGQWYRDFMRDMNGRSGVNEKSED